MFFPSSPIQEKFSKHCLLLACFFAFSFNHIVLTKYQFVLGQASFYFIALALVTSHFRIDRRALISIACLIVYCLGSAAFFCLIGESLCTSRPYTAAISIVLVFLTVQYVASLVAKNPGFEILIENYLVYGAWALVILAIPDIWTIAKGGANQGSPYGLSYLSALGVPPLMPNRLRGFTQEPSYLGMVISVLYPICFMRLNQKFTLLKLLLVLGLWICLAYSLSRTGIFSCFLLSILILIVWPKRLLVATLLLGAFALSWHQFPQLRTGIFLNFSWVPLMNSSALDGSSLVRSAHIVAAIKTWLANPLFGVGLGQSGYMLDQFYPAWYTPSSPEYGHWQPKGIFGGIPSMSFIPRLLAEIGLLGVAILFWWAMPGLRAGLMVIKENPSARILAFAFLGFLIASFGVDGYLYLPAWVIFGAFWGLVRQKNFYKL